MNPHPFRMNYGLIAKAIAFYEENGFTYVEVPWAVTDRAVNVTLPPGHTAFQTMDGALVGSAEQSFIQLALDGSLPPGRYVSATPCFRDDPVDDLHQRMFFKVELIDLEPIAKPFAKYAVRKMAALARNFMCAQPNAWGVQIVEYDHGFDIELNDIELGSYGYRAFEGWHWIYGTGVAEPRFSIATADRNG